ncbi:MAG TPA: DEAD/DEAH box helicase [Dermatophilaceae bacterium]|nr:DEAD/DEAH box helicase [Dermatophilaceae bacterium]
MTSALSVFRRSVVVMAIPTTTPTTTPTAVPPVFEPTDILARLAQGARAGSLRHVQELPARPAEAGPWPEWVAPALWASVTGSGIPTLWSHQSELAELGKAGVHAVVATGTASGKSLGYLLPLLTDLLEGAGAPNGRGATALYLAPTKALAADQLARVEALALPGLRVACYDGDTEAEQRRYVREHAQYVLTNPDMVHRSVLPRHQHWSGFLRALRYVVIDECHVYRGVFGTHLAVVVRRLRRLCARYRSSPTFLLASATVAEPAAHASALVGMPVAPVVRDGSPRESMTLAYWEPGGRDDGGFVVARRGAVVESADLLAELVLAGVQTVAFARSRAGVEVLAERARRRLEAVPSLSARVAAYRGGYLPEERRALEAQLRSGALRGLAATSALELGVDVSGLDAVVLAGWPGTWASLWQQVGRAGRRGGRSLAVYVAGEDLLDTYLVRHPETLLQHPVEATVVDPANPHVLGPHLAAAAAELPVTEADEQYFGPVMRPVLDQLVAHGVLRRRPNGWFWPHDEPAAAQVGLRGMGEVVRIVERGSGRVLGTVDRARAGATVHAGAVYLHQGQPYVVTELDLADASALVVAGDPGWSTSARSVSAFDLVREERKQCWGPVRLSFGVVDVTTRVVSFLRRLPTGEVLGEHALDLPEARLQTRAVWWTVPESLLAHAGVLDVPGAAHAAEHAAIGMLPLVATSDRWDVGGVSTALHPDTGMPTILVYDGYPGGAGFAERGYREARVWLAATRDAVAACGCADGCPWCIQSPKCGNGNQPLDKAGAVALLSCALDQGTLT